MAKSIKGYLAKSSVSDIKRVLGLWDEVMMNLTRLGNTSSEVEGREEVNIIVDEIDRTLKAIHKLKGSNTAGDLLGESDGGLERYVWNIISKRLDF